MKKRTKELWFEIPHATREQMELSLAQRREAVCKELCQMANDCDSYNENWNKGQPIILVFDFTEDIAEHRAMFLNEP